MTFTIPERIQTAFRKIEDEYKFECEAGPIKNCTEWQQIKAEFAEMARTNNCL